MTAARPVAVEAGSERLSGPELMADPELVRADRHLLAANVLAGTCLLAPLAVPSVVIAFRRLNNLARRGRLVRPWSVTIVAMFAMIDAGANFWGWSVDVFAHDVPLIQTFHNLWGKIAEGGYYIDYNSTPIGGYGNAADKTLQVFGLLFAYPMRMAAGWGFLKMKRWGLQAMIYSTFIHMAFLASYVAMYCLQFDLAAGSSLFGPLGYWAIALPMTSSFVTLPYLITLRRDGFWD